jgi:dihydroneopterin aldolase
MSHISIIDLEVFCRVGVTDEEHAKPQRLLVSVDMEYDFSSAAVSDRIGRTIDYFEVSQRLIRFGERQGWRIIESLATEMAEKILAEFRPQSVTVEVRKFPIPEARYVSVTVTKAQPPPQTIRRPWWWRGW